LERHGSSTPPPSSPPADRLAVDDARNLIVEVKA